MIRSGPWTARLGAARGSAPGRLLRAPGSSECPVARAASASAVEAGMIDRQLGFADVERPDRHRRGSRARHQPAIGRRTCASSASARLAATGEQELGTEQTDALRPLLARPLGVVGRLDVCFEPDLDAVRRDAWEPPDTRRATARTRRAERLRRPNCCIVSSSGLIDHFAGRRRPRRAGIRGQ